MDYRKGFNFFKSYYDVYMELDNKNKVEFMDGLLKKQFHGIEPDLKGMSRFAYISQKHSIDAQVKGFEDKTGIILRPPTVPPSDGGGVPPSVQVEGKVEVEVQYTVDKKINVSGLVKLKQSEIDTLIKKHGVPNYKIMIEILHNYKLSNGKQYKSDYGAINLWVTKELKKRTELKKSH